MSKINNHIEILYKEQLCDIIFVAGSTRSGKIILSRILSSLEKAENIKVDYLMEFFAPFRRMGEISEEACIAFLRYSIYLTTYNSFIGRNVNMRANDYSSIWNTGSPLKYLNRVFNDNSTTFKTSGFSKDRGVVDETLKLIKEKNPIVHMMVHYELMHADILLKAFPKCRIYLMSKHPVELIYSWINKDYGNNYWNNPRVDVPTFKYKNQIVPYYAYKWEKEFIKLNEVDKVIHIVSKQNSESINIFNHLDTQDKNRIKIINFNNLVTDPYSNIEKICSELKTKKTFYTDTVLSEENCPRDIDLKDRDKKYKYIKNLASDLGIERLNKAIKNYENSLLS